MAQFISHPSNIAELTGAGVQIATVEAGSSLAAEIYYGGYDAVILKEEQITPDFFDLKTRVAGEILQKFSNFRLRVAIVGNFNKYPSTSLSRFIRESNRQKQINFVASVGEAVEVLSA